MVYLPYAVIEFYCFIFALTVLLRLDRSIGSEHEVRQLRRMIYAYLGMLATDILWAAIEDDLLLLPPVLNLAINAVSVACIALGCYFWYCYVDARLHPTRVERKWRLLALRAPIFIVCVLDFVSIFTGFLFRLDQYGHYESTVYFVYFHTAANYFYLLIPTIASLIRFFQSKSRQDRAEYLTYCIYMVVPLISGLLEESLPTVPVLALSIFMIIHILFLMIQNSQIYNDALTDLNNRRRLVQYLEAELPKVSETKPLLLMMMDLNHFKQINDRCGHIEGDNALRTFAAVLRQTAAGHRAFLARYGGDEFCLVTAETNGAALMDEIRNNLSAVRPAAGYRLTVSIGCTVVTAPEPNPDAALARADEALYEDKQEYHRRFG